MGFGDVKLAGLIGGVLGYLSWTELLVGTGAAFVLGAAGGVLLMARGGAGRGTAVPFGPFMLAGALISLCAGGSIATAYLRLVGVA